ncbi:hypothetical protein GCM10007859_14320 [Brevundimonas denitrificans]|uniref:Uncharacterized protein n=1 Tax=Brevundimonas denitrificans TaxID=1443434 RepID=A0ABQ6BHM2_9CAUL|nr:hypothetical protein GCM10007859_14320 [Brevundimonas denitrificans]
MRAALAANRSVAPAIPEAAMAKACMGRLRTGEADYPGAGLSRSLTGMVNDGGLTAGRGGERLTP